MMKWVMEAWGYVLDVMVSVVTMTRGCFMLCFKKVEYVTLVLRKFWHIEMDPIMLKRWSPLFDPERENIGFRLI